MRLLARTAAEIGAAKEREEREALEQETARERRADDVTPQRRLVSGSYDWTVRVWDPESGEPLHVLVGHSYSVVTLAITPQGRVVSGSEDTTVWVWDPESGEPLHVLDGHGGRVQALAVTPG